MDEKRIEGTLDDVTGRAKRAAGDFTGDAGLRAEGLTDQLRGQAESTAGRVRETVSDLAENAQQLSGRVYEASSKAGSYVADTARSAPLVTLAVGMVIGFAIGALVSRPSEPPPPSYRFWR